MSAPDPNRSGPLSPGDGPGLPAGPRGERLCASCDRCRARKTKCDGGRPCANCVARYRKTVKADDGLQGIDVSVFDCHYSPAKRRGPIPGKGNQARAQAGGNKRGAEPAVAPHPPIEIASQLHAEQIAMANSGLDDFSLGLDGLSVPGADVGQQPVPQKVGVMDPDALMNASAEQLQTMLQLQQQLLLQQQQMQQAQQQQQIQQLTTSMGGPGGGNSASLQQVVNNLTANTATMMGGGSDFTGGAVGNATVGNQLLGAQNINSTAGNFSVQQSFPVQPQQPQQFFPQPQAPDNGGRSSKRTHRVDPVPSQMGSCVSGSGLPNSVAAHLPLLRPNDPEGSALRSYYELSTNDVLNLPPIPSDEEYCQRLGGSYLTGGLPTYDQSALQAARFSELALGALANNQVPLALELSNASVMCLRNCVEEPSHPSCMYDVARAYLLHGIFRSFRGDMVRYFKYRRVCLTHILQLGNMPNTEALVAAISFHDAWAYMMHNAAEDALPDIDESLPRLSNGSAASGSNAIQAKYGCSTSTSAIASDPINQMWMQGSPTVFLNNEAGLISRSLDGLACAIRSCCDQANQQFEQMAAAMNMPASPQASSGSCGRPTATGMAVMANENELCSRNIVMSSKTLLEQNAAMSGKIKKHGLTMIASAMSAFLVDGQADGGDPGADPASGNAGDGMGGLTDTQVKNLMSACETIVQHPILLHAPGPLYHMATNAAILLCHLLNGIQAKENEAKEKGERGSNGSGNRLQGILFDEVLDTFMATRKVLNIHRKSLPVKLRCHGIPRPNGIGPFKSVNPKELFVELGETLMCMCRGCQGFVLMGCSPCVAAERAMKAVRRASEELAAAQEPMPWDLGTGATENLDRELGDMEDMHLDDDALLDVLSRILQN